MTAATHWGSIGDGDKPLGSAKSEACHIVAPERVIRSFESASQQAPERVDVFPRRGRDKEVDGNIGVTTDGPRYCPRYIATLQRSLSPWWPSILERRHAPMFVPGNWATFILTGIASSARWGMA